MRAHSVPKRPDGPDQIQLPHAPGRLPAELRHGRNRCGAQRSGDTLGRALSNTRTLRLGDPYVELPHPPPDVAIATADMSNGLSSRAVKVLIRR
jgi:hypothetical protein